MSFGYSVGDFIAVGKLTYEISECLQTTSSATEQFQELLRELKLLEAALRHLNKLGVVTPSSLTIDSIECAALSCHKPLDDFLTKIQKYDAALGVRSQTTSVQRAKRKLQWTFTMQDDIKRLQTYLHTHVATINVLLLQHGLERLDLAEKTTDAFNQRVEHRLSAAQKFLTTISSNVTG